MTKQYTKTVHVDEVLAGDEVYEVKNDSAEIVYSSASIDMVTEVITAGTTENAATLNNIEEGIDALDDSVNVDGVTLLQETSGPDTLEVGDIADGDFLRRNGTGLVGNTVAQTKTILGVYTLPKEGTISNPQAVYAQRPQIPIMDVMADLHVVSWYIDTFQATQELAGDLKYADDMDAGSFANATVIDVCDTTSGKSSATSGLDNPAVAAGKKIYFQMDASPHVDIKDFKILFFYTYD